MTATSEDSSPSLYHHVRWTVETEDVRGEFVCTAPEGSACRMSCAADPPCEESCGGDVETGEEHPQKDYGYCNHREWLSEESIEFYYGGERTELRAGPVVTRWHPDGYFKWTYPDHEHRHKTWLSGRWLLCECGDMTANSEYSEPVPA